MVVVAAMMKVGLLALAQGTTMSAMLKVWNSLAVLNHHSFAFENASNCNLLFQSSLKEGEIVDSVNAGDASKCPFSQKYKIPFDPQVLNHVVER